jgi:cell division protein ZapE
MRPDSFPPRQGHSNRILDRYLKLVADGHFERDAAQESVARKLDRLCERLEAESLAKKSSALGLFFGAKHAEATTLGLYLWGSVGRGKTMLMDLFFEEVAWKHKRRVHFHAFMAEVQARLHALRQNRKPSGRGDDIVAPLAAALADEARLLCFDEFSVTDIADAMILGRLFGALWEHGVVVVATSNVAPGDLYKDGLNRALFLPFIALIERHMEVVRLDASKDFRLEKLSGDPVYLVPADAAARQALDRTFRHLTGQERGRPTRLDVLGRHVNVPQAAAGVARFGFGDLCEAPLGAVDYLAIARSFHTVLIDAIPVIGAEQRNEAKRFILLIDTLYDRHVKLIASAAAEPDALYPAGTGREAFEFARTASRLIEMRSGEYLAMPHGQAESRGSGDTSGIAET